MRNVLALAMIFTLSCSFLDEDEEFVNEYNYSIKSNCDFQNIDTVAIGSQVWMAKNLNCADAIDCYDKDCGTKIIGICGGGKQENCDKYGRLYDWATTMGFPSDCNTNSCASYITPKHRGICPEGWHIPSNEDWDTLLSYVGSGSEASRKLKAKEGWGDKVYDDEFGFAALPGYFDYQGYYPNINVEASWWSASQRDKDDAYNFYMTQSDLYYGKDTYMDKASYKLSVRCLKD